MGKLVSAAVVLYDHLFSTLVGREREIGQCSAGE